MDELEISDFSRWLNTTEQQTDILKTIYRLQHRNRNPSPKNIEEEYYATHNKRMQKPNLFHILRQLIEKDLVVKEGQARYGVNLEGLRSALKARERVMEAELKQFKSVCAEADEHLMRASLKPLQPVMRYYDYAQRTDKLIQSLRDAKKFYVIGVFPNICLTYPIAQKLKKESYIEFLRKRCFKDKELSISWVSYMDTEQLFRYALMLHGKRGLAVQECESVLNQLQSFLETYDNLEVYFLDRPVSPLYLKLQLIERERPDEFFLNVISLKELESNYFSRGYLYVKSREAAEYMKTMFLRSMEETTPLRGKKGDKVIGKLKEEIKEKEKD